MPHLPTSGEEARPASEPRQTAQAEAEHFGVIDPESASIKAGETANFTALLDDPSTVDPMKLKAVRIWGTVFEGELHPLIRN